MDDLSGLVSRKQWNGMFEWSDDIGMVAGPSEASEVQVFYPHLLLAKFKTL